MLSAGTPLRAQMGGAQVLVLDEVVAGGDRAHVLAERHPERRVPALAQPAGQADMVGMQVRGDRRASPACRRSCSAKIFSHSSRVASRVDAGVDDGPAVLLLDQPQVDVVELEGQRHAQPVDAGRDVLDVAGLRHVAAGKAQLRQQALRKIGVNRAWLDPSGGRRSGVTTADRLPARRYRGGRSPPASRSGRPPR